MRDAIVCLGELLLRLSAPGHERLLQSPGLHVAIGGAEANVAVCLARFGHKAKLASVVAQNDIGYAAIGEVRKYGVDTSLVQTSPGRMGLYFLTHGAVSRPSQVLYDRAGSAFAQQANALLDPQTIVKDAAWLHVSGVTPAIGQNAADCAVGVAQAARASGVKVSFDGNYRGQMWAAWQGDGPAILRQILGCATLAFINERDLELILGQTFQTRQAAFIAAFEAFPHLEWIAATTRGLSSVTQQSLAGELVSRTGRWVSRSYELIGVIDRIGGGDAFAAGVLHGLIKDLSPQNCIEFGVASGVMKHSIPGDFNLTSVEEVQSLIDEGGLDVKR